MRVFIILWVAMLVSFSAFSQSDFLVLKKKHKPIKKFYPGNELILKAATGVYEGNIRQIARDSIYLIRYNTQRYMTSAGGIVIDTLGAYHFGIPYKDVLVIYEDRKGWNWQATGAAFFGGGTLLTAAGLVTWVVTEKDSRYYARPELVGTAAALAAIGWLLMKTGAKQYHIGSKYKLDYIQLLEDSHE